MVYENKQIPVNYVCIMDNSGKHLVLDRTVWRVFYVRSCSLLPHLRVSIYSDPVSIYRLVLPVTTGNVYIHTIYHAKCRSTDWSNF